MGTHQNIGPSFSSPFIEKRLNEIKDRKSKNAFLESVMTNPSAVILNENNGHRTALFPGNKGPRTSTWRQTIQMAYDLNKAGFDVAFIPETNNGICADCILKTGNSYKLADFKYCITTNSSTLSKELTHGFKQASTIVLKLKHLDAGAFKNAIDYLLRNGIPYGNLILINQYGKTLIINYKDIKSKRYIRKIKGFL